jgi:hypothetical protein
MLIWVASFPRSGNTFLRMQLNHRYGIRSSVIYDVDGVAERLGADMVGFTPRTAPLEQLREAAELHFVKTHRQLDDDVDPGDRAICLVRDGRDALVSWARQASEGEPSRYETELRTRIMRTEAIGTGSWGSNVLSWLHPSAPHRPVLRYTDLVAAPAQAVARVMAIVAPEMAACSGTSVPGFDQLHRADDKFFRRGINGSYRDEMPDELHDLFWSRRDNTTAMSLLGYSR